MCVLKRRILRMCGILNAIISRTTATRNEHSPFFFFFNFPENLGFKAHWTITKLDFWILISEVSNSAQGVGHLLNGWSLRTQLRRSRTTLILLRFSFLSFCLLFSLLLNLSILLPSLLTLLTIFYIFICNCIYMLYRKRRILIFLNSLLCLD